jgi:hypothetical protein
MIENYNNFDKIMHLDFRDIVIQKDPFEFMNKQSDKEIFVVSEGMKIKDNHWNTMDMAYFNKTQIQFHKDDFSDYYVINGGTIGGNIFPLSQLFLMLWVNSNRNSQSNTDQATLNYLYPYFKSNPKIFPKVYREGRLKDGRYYAEIEKLDTKKVEKEWYELEMALEVVGEVDTDVFESTIDQVFIDIIFGRKDANQIYKKLSTDKQAQQLFKKWIEFLAKTAKYLMDSGYGGLDLHRYNFGYDPKGNIKAIDI